MPAEELVKAGHKVQHVHPSGATDPHQPLNEEWPDWLKSEGDRLRKLEQQRKAGMLKKPEKSRVDRSTEAVAAQLMRPAEKVDAMQEMRDAENQPALVIAQRKLARMQRVSEEKGVMAKKVVTNTPQWIKDEALQQQEWIATRKKEKEAAKASGANPLGKQGFQEGAGSSSSSSSSSAMVPEEVLGEASGEAGGDSLLVECAGCGGQFSWSELQAGDDLRSFLIPPYVRR